MKKYLIYIIGCFFALNSYAQKDFRFRNFSINDGLSQSSATSIIQDDNNALWIGTQDGLNRFDGREFQVFTVDNTKGLESAYIKCSAIDSEGNLWFGTNNGLTKYDRSTETFQTFFIRTGQVFQIEDISLGEDGSLWVASTEGGLFKFDKSSGKFQSYYDIIPSKQTTHVLFSENRNIIVSTADKGIFTFDIYSKKIQRAKFPSSARPAVNRIIDRGNGEILLATSNGVYSLEVKKNVIETMFGEWSAKTGGISVVDALYHDNLHAWLIATTSQGLFVLYDNGDTYQNTEDYFQKTALLNNSTNILYEDGAGSIWIGSQRGLSTFDPESRGFLGVGPSGNEDSGIPSPSVWCFEESENAQYIFIGTDRGVSSYDKKTGKFRQFYRQRELSESSRKETVVLNIQIVNDSLLLVACTDGVFELKITQNTYNYSLIKYGSNEIEQRHKRSYSIEPWKDDTYLIGTWGGALLFNVKTKKVQEFVHDSSKPNATISKGICRLVYTDNDGQVWLTTSTGGLNRAFEVEGKLVIKPYKHNDFIKAVSTEYITSIYHAKNGIYWMGTLGSGLLKWDETTKKVSVFGQKDGIPNEVIYGVLRDTKGFFWLSTNKGLCQFDPVKKRARNFTEVHGLMSNEFNLGAYYHSSSGKMYFGGIHGYNYFVPSELSSKKEEISVVFTRFKLENKWLKPGEEGSMLLLPISETRELFLTYKERSFTIRFQPSNLSNSELVNYKYVLKGSDEGEILIGTNNEIHFNALAPGTYELKVYGRLGDGSWSTYPATITIHIAAPFWLTWWFWLLIAGAVALFVRWVFRRRIEHARREQIQLEMKIRDRTREIQLQNEKIEEQRKKIEEERNKVVKQQKLLQIEKDKTEKLLRNIIPASTAEELKTRGKARARAYSKVSVLFTDFVGFTKISERMNPTELVKKLDVYFTKFDEIIVANNLEKIKTIGDAYMCAGGVPVRNNTNPIDTCLAALQIQAYMENRKNDAIANGREYWDLRLGINTGEVTAGVIGSERLAYDIWGATVNQAQRMEMLGEPGKVTITGETFQFIEPYFECTFKGKAQSKSRGLMDMYVVDRIKPELSVKGAGTHPNARFHEIVSLHLYSSINYYKAERHIMRILEKDLSKNLHYHGIAHTKDVVSAVERIALLEDVTDEGLFLLKSAATYHDAGFIEQYDKNEPIGARLAVEILPKYGYTPEHIEAIKELIYVTEIPHKPVNKLQEIMCDADLDYLGRDDFHEIADRLRRELKEHGKITSDRQWDEIQVSFLRSHKYFTKTAIKTRKKKKKQNLKEVIARLERNEYKD